MPVNRDADIYLDGKPFQLSRATSMRGRAWTRTGSVDAPSRRSPTDTRYGVVADVLDHPEVWEDWSGDSGYAYRDPDKLTAIHWSEGFERRFPGQLVHCQALQTLPARYASVNLDVDRIADVPLPGVSSPPAGAGAVILLGKGKVATLVPTGLNTAGSAFDMSLEATGGGITFAGRPATFGSYTYIPNVGSTFYRRGHDGTMTVSAMPAAGFRVAGSRLWRYHSKNLLQSCAAYADPLLTANWSATLPIGDGNKPILDMVDISQQLFCGLQDGLYTPIDIGDLQNVLAALKDESNTDNCRDLAVFNTAILAPHLAGLIEYQQSSTMAVAREIGPNTGKSDRSPIKGRIRCIATHGPWAYAGLWTGSESYVLTGRENANGYYWQSQQRVPNGAKISRIHFDGITTASGGAAEIPTRMWVTTEKANTAGTAPVYFMPIPRGHGNPLTAEPGFTPNFCGSARADLGRVDWGSPATHKLFKSVEIRADSLASGARYADIFYTLDGGIRTRLGRAQDSPVSQLWFPVGAERWVAGKELEISVESFTTTPAVSPVYRSITVRGSLMPDTQDTVTAIIRIGDGIRDRSQHQLRPGAVMLDDLREMADPRRLGTVPHMLRDLAGATQWVNVLRPVSESEVYQQGEENPEIAATVTMAVLEMTTNVQLLGVGYEVLSMATT